MPGHQVYQSSSFNIAFYFVYSEAAIVAAAATAANSLRHRGSELPSSTKLGNTESPVAPRNRWVGYFFLVAEATQAKSNGDQRSLTDDGSTRAETGLRIVVSLKIFKTCKRLFTVLNHCFRE